MTRPHLTIVVLAESLRMVGFADGPNVSTSSPLVDLALTELPNTVEAGSLLAATVRLSLSKSQPGFHRLQTLALQSTTSALLEGVYISESDTTTTSFECYLRCIRITYCANACFEIIGSPE
jgi:hypothetical protein